MAYQPPKVEVLSQPRLVANPGEIEIIVEVSRHETAGWQAVIPQGAYFATGATREAAARAVVQRYWRQVELEPRCEVECLLE